MKNDNFEASEQTSGENLSRQLGVWDAAALLVGVILGSGIFVAPSVIAQATPHFSVAALLWLLGGVAAGAGAITYAECGARLPKTGGFYIFYREAYGEPVAFVGGLLAQVITYPASLAAIALIFAQYLLQLLPVLEGAEVWVAAGALLAAGLINYVGVKAGAMSQKILTAFKVLALILVVVAALFAPDIKSNLQFYTPGQPVLIGFAAAVAAVMTLMWTYDGWADVTLIAGELKNPARDLGRAVLFGMGSLIVLYILVHFA
ncbi:amino acid permease, partial [Myxococcota bacterium]|nr:amino acid permease [Myxococcota bacterium]